MTLTQFIRYVMTSLLNFEANMSVLNDTGPKSMDEWMKLFLAWAEWRTDEHDKYWEGE